MVLRNPKSYIKKHGDMSQRIPLRKAPTGAEKIADCAAQGCLQLNAHATVDRYYGAQYYTNIYDGLEHKQKTLKGTEYAIRKQFIETDEGKKDQK